MNAEGRNELIRSLDEAELKYDEHGLIPAIIQEAGMGRILMLAYMNRESLEKTLETGKTCFYSRSRQELWHKGETSGNVQEVHSIRYDCDADTLLVSVTQTGAACHTGEKSCFFREMAVLSEIEMEQHIIPRLIDVLKDRRENPQHGSYTNYLFDSGIDKILKKIGEESAEVIIASKNSDKPELVGEICDLLFHMLVLMNDRQILVEDVLAELTQRHGKKKSAQG